MADLPKLARVEPCCGGLGVGPTLPMGGLMSCCAGPGCPRADPHTHPNFLKFFRAFLYKLKGTLWTCRALQLPLAMQGLGLGLGGQAQPTPLPSTLANLLSLMWHFPLLHHTSVELPTDKLIPFSWLLLPSYPLQTLQNIPPLC